MQNKVLTKPKFNKAQMRFLQDSRCLSKLSFTRGGALALLVPQTLHFLVLLELQIF
jgi:hypothetical protein